MTWTRRQWLECAGAATGSALMLGCGGAPRRRLGPAVEASSDEVRGWLGEAVELAGQRWGEVEAVAMRHDHAAAAADVEGASGSIDRRSGAVLAGIGGDGRRYEASCSQLDRDSVLELARHLVELAEAQRPGSSGAGAAKMMSAAKAMSAASAARATDARARGGQRRGAGGPLTTSAATLAQQVAELATRADRHGGSRIVYRGAGVDLDATSVWYADGARQLEQRMLRRRAAVTVVASINGRPTGAEIAHGRGAWALVRGALELADAQLAARLDGPETGPSEQELEGELERVLRLTTPAAVAAGPTDVVLDPSVVGRLFEALVAAAARPEHAPAIARFGERARPPATTAQAASRWALVAAPSSAQAYGGYVFDERGGAAAPLELMRDGQLTAALAARGGARAPGPRLRHGHLGDFAAAPPHLELAAERGQELGELLEGIADGYALEGGTFAHVDLAADRFTLHARLARQLRKGTYSGRAFGEIELSGSLGQLLDSIAGVTAARRVSSRRELTEDGPRFASLEVPWLRARAELRPRQHEGGR